MDLVITTGDREQWIGLNRDLSGAERPLSYEVSLSLCGDLLAMRARAGKPPLFAPDVAPGAWHFGLWHFDCAELFLLCSATGRYLEVNLGANGAHWIGVFDAPRHQWEGYSAEGWATTRFEASDSQWSSGIEFSWARVVEALGGTPDRGNVTAILDGDDLRSLAAIDDQKPDFHVPERWRPLVFR